MYHADTDQQRAGAAPLISDSRLHAGKVTRDSLMEGSRKLSANTGNKGSHCLKLFQAV